MKEKKIVVIGLAILVMFVFLAQPAGAASSWKVCQVVSVEADDMGVVKVKLMKTSDNSTRAFTAPAGEENRILAVALTAMTNGMEVSVYLNWAVPLSEIERMVLLSS